MARRSPDARHLSDADRGLEDRIWKEVVAFVVLTLGASTVFYVALIRLGSLERDGAALLVMGLMWTPGLVALALQLNFRRTLRGLGWGWGGGRYWVLGYLAPILYAGLTYAVIWASPLGDVEAEAFGRLASHWYVIPLGALQGCLFALGEELGWRGFLVPRLAQVLDFDRTSIVSGLVWAVWHVPLILFAGYSGGAPALYSVACFTVMVVGLSYLFAGITLRSGSVWPAMLLHASHNQWIQGFFDQATVDTGPTEYWIGEFGAGLALAAILVAILARQIGPSTRTL
ncbi:MAG TPA: type II CAAX endopeptidase family protein [Thermoanaerobaculia bacterium]|nr:type II CAAX endopeptidase family protein [Thermoanaerobaculia bacterium]